MRKWRVFPKPVSFFNNSKSAIDISYGTINMTGPILFNNNSEESTVTSYSGAIAILIKFKYVC